MDNTDNIMCERIEQIIKKFRMNVKHGFIMIPSNLYTTEHIDQYTVFSSHKAKNECVQKLHYNLKNTTVSDSFLQTDTIQYLIISPDTVYIR